MRRAIGELTGLVHFFNDLLAPPSFLVRVHLDSQSALHIAKKSVFLERTKHIELDCHFVRQQCLSDLISLCFVPSSSQLAYLFTKPLSGPSNLSILGKLDVAGLPSTLRGGGVGISSKKFSFLT
ncbi:hypothetical protein MTR67_040380 [Solanum verrucosum]|uniref:Uncharacterized protein n=1 Tax=Solanum verrucosum TaxID=315347 RepID=A0AAF0UJP6_SOLVR|nr:hypothetical protein MTR67_040380 [Solanum verrucosum]